MMSKEINIAVLGNDDLPDSLFVDMVEQERGIVIMPETEYIIKNLRKVEIEEVKRPRRETVRHANPPRSMTTDELAYYQKHKTLSGFITTL